MVTAIRTTVAHLEPLAALVVARAYEGRDMSTATLALAQDIVRRRLGALERRGACRTLVDDAGTVLGFERS